MGKNPIATFEIEDGGAFKAELYPEEAPNTVRNFISLANKGFYNGTAFHRIVPEFCIQGGDPKGNGTGDPGYRIPGEFSKNGVDNKISHATGVLSMARGIGYDSAGCQFFIVLDDENALHLDGGYAAFGRVVEGMDTVRDIECTPINPRNEKPFKVRTIKSVTVETFGEEYPEPEKIVRKTWFGRY